ncbi:unnamed protein product [Ilex paraguariensis]|uniref:Uncharacterized protein n=1 Tax=Ilex paraguariensis TaxID=185542 RepID=A0ABC8SYK4_9AQUA
MAKRVGAKMNRRREDERQSLLTRAVNSVFAFFRFAEFEILFVLFFLVAFLIFKDLDSYGGSSLDNPLEVSLGLRELRIITTHVLLGYEPMYNFFISVSSTTSLQLAK